jgi:hypothetical protein
MITGKSKAGFQLARERDSFGGEAAASGPEPARINLFVWRQKQMLQTSYWKQ